MPRDAEDPAMIALKRDVGKRLLAIRTKTGLSQGAFAKTFGSNQQEYGKWEKGKLLANPAQMIPLCSLYNVDFNFLFSGSYTGLSGDLAAALAVALAQQ